jgi:hypothetical protein
MFELKSSNLRAKIDELFHSGFAEKGWVVVDGFLQPGLCQTLRKEAETLYAIIKGFFNVSQSTSWDSVTQQTRYYDKHNVYSTSLQGARYSSSRAI